MFEDLPPLDPQFADLDEEEDAAPIELNPQPFFVVKTYLLESTVSPKRTKGTKVFINVCRDPKAPFSDTPGEAPQDDVPVILGGESIETDNKGEKCYVFDCCINSELLDLTKGSAEALALFAQHCMRVVSHSHGLKLSPDYKLPKLRYKGNNGRPPKILIRPSRSRILNDSSDTEDAGIAASLNGMARKILEDTSNGKSPQENGTGKKAAPSSDLVYREDDAGLIPLVKPKPTAQAKSLIEEIVERPAPASAKSSKSTAAAAPAPPSKSTPNKPMIQEIVESRKVSPKIVKTELKQAGFPRYHYEITVGGSSTALEESTVKIDDSAGKVYVNSSGFNEKALDIDLPKDCDFSQIKLFYAKDTNTMSIFV
ncbi:PIH1 family [Myxozyma melibiosi]|uniref:PIH1 family n=1 Tax=Myxozyma melibiosi TaxID=54550 RepID=A0ABR1F7E8_9ASCO